MRHIKIFTMYRIYVAVLFFSHRQRETNNQAISMLLRSQGYLKRVMEILVEFFFLKGQILLKQD